MTDKLVVIINSLKVPKIKILLYEMKFLLRNYSCLQKPWLGGYRPQIPVLCPQLNLLNPLPPNKIPGYATVKNPLITPWIQATFPHPASFQHSLYKYAEVSRFSNRNFVKTSNLSLECYMLNLLSSPWFAYLNNIFRTERTLSTLANVHDVELNLHSANKNLVTTTIKCAGNFVYCLLLRSAAISVSFLLP